MNIQDLIKEEIIKELKDARDSYPITYSDKIYDAVTIDEGIAEVSDVGVRKGLEMAISIIEANKGRKRGRKYDKRRNEKAF